MSVLDSQESQTEFSGRKTIYTDETSINKSNIVKVLTESLIDHENNRSVIKFLLDYERNVNPVIDNRIKEIRPEINVKVKDNMAAFITDFKLGYEWGTPITYVQRAKQCMHDDKDPEKDDLRIAALNEMLEEESKSAKDQELARYIEICGVGYRLILPKKEIYGTSVFDILTLNPMNTFVVYSNDVYKRPMMACSYITRDDGTSIYGCYTQDTYFEIENVVKIVNEKKTVVYQIKNGYGQPIYPKMIPIVEYIGNYDKMGCFEGVIPEIDAMCIVKSDRVNDVVQCVQSMIWGNNIEIDEDDKDKSHNGMWLLTKSVGNGYDPKLEYLSHEMSQNGLHILVQDLVDSILLKTHIPGRQEQGGGSTGSAMNLSNGWQDAEVAAKKKEPIISKSERECLKIILAIINDSKEVPEDIKNLELQDITIKFSRNRNYDIATKTNALTALLNAGIDGLRAIEVVGLFSDSQQVWNDSKETIRQKQQASVAPKSNFDQTSDTLTEENTKDKKTMPDITDQPSKQSMVDES